MKKYILLLSLLPLSFICNAQTEKGWIVLGDTLETPVKTPKEQSPRYTYDPFITKIKDVEVYFTNYMIENIVKSDIKRLSFKWTMTITTDGRPKGLVLDINNRKELSDQNMADLGKMLKNFLTIGHFSIVNPYEFRHSGAFTFNF